MLVIRNSLFSEKKEKVKLKDIPYGTHGLSSGSITSPSIGELTGRRLGMEVADEMDDEGKHPLEILDESPKEAKKAGKVAGAAVGGGIGLITSMEAKRGLRKLSKIVKNPERLSELQKQAEEIIQNSGKESFNGKLAGKGKRIIEKVSKNPEKVSKVLKGAAIPSAIVLTGYGAYHGMKTGGKRAEKATKDGNLERLIKKHKINKE